ncbi:hypothetical protein EBI00_02090 [Marinomonas hwangdonensis]|uniref:Uncharacterized protein n=1 Tax=Marinomonas hwangdonensis TaxID=1053647 RepID=A0A3M8QA26_9GAMM|nr:hypothetical protein [Marinomonas hwangdonensis]RNF52918.1 hypothetical protein EBI00_02090 [Marinomonas hwangdonensis]
MLVFSIVFALFIICLVPILIRWRRQQRELKKQRLTYLSRRSEQVFHALDVISDRYLAKDTKVFMIEYLLFIIKQLENANYTSDFLVKHADIMHWLTDINATKKNASVKKYASEQKVNTPEQLNQTHNALKCLLQETRYMAKTYGVSQVAIGQHLVNLRYAYALAYRDLLVYQARLDLDNDKKAQALEKYRTALSVMEQNDSVNGAKKEIMQLQSRIHKIEQILFPNKSKAESKSV